MIDTDYSLCSTCIYISFRFKSMILGIYRPLFNNISRPNPPHSAYPPWLITVSLTSHFPHERTVASYIWVNFRSANPNFPPLEFGALVPCSSIPSVSQCLYVIKTNYITWMFRSVDSSADHRCRVEICRDRHDWRSCKICASCVNFPGKQRDFSYDLPRTTRFAHTKWDFTLKILKFYTLC